MRFSSSLVAFVYLGFAAAAVIPAVPTLSTALPVKTQPADIDARAVVGQPANLGTGTPLPTSLSVPTNSVVPKLSDVSMPVRRDDATDLDDCEDDGAAVPSVPVSTTAPTVSAV